MNSDTDVVIIGAGPNGLCMAKSLADAGLRVTVVDRQSENELANPAFDGREIALTHQSKKLMHALGLWERIDAQAISLLKDAKVFNGTSLFSLNILHGDAAQSELGYLVANHLIRQAAYDAVKSSPSIHLKCAAQVTQVATDQDHAQVTFASGEVLHAKLLIAADSRFSETRRAMGISADMHDFGKTMMVCVMEHEVPHAHTAWEWFDYGQTLALLPMNGARSSVVVTLAPEQMQALMKMSDEDFDREMSARFHHRLGRMHLVSTKHAYPLVTTYANRLVGERFALIGDAAVGMHPVTAHGFNFGLAGVATLTHEIKAALEAKRDFAGNHGLLRYEKAHRHHTRPLFLATHAIAKLYGSQTPPARFLRSSALRIGSRIKPFKRAVAGFLAAAN